MISKHRLNEESRYFNVSSGLHELIKEDPSSTNDNIAEDGKTTSLYLQPGTVIDGTELINPFGFGGIGPVYPTSPTKFSILGDGELHYESTDRFNFAIPLFGLEDAYVKLKQLTTVGPCKPAQTSSINSSVNIERLICEGDSAFASDTHENQDPVRFNRVARIGSILDVGSNQNPVTDKGLVRQQYSLNFLPGSLDVINVDSIFLNEDSIGYAYMADIKGSRTEGSGGNFRFTAGSITNLRTSFIKYPDFLNTSNQARNWGEVLYNGGGKSVPTRTIFSSEVGVIMSPIPALAIHGFWLDDSSHIKTEIKQALTEGCVSIGMFDPHLDNGSTITITGNFINLTEDQPLAIIYAPNISDDSRIVFRDCTFTSASIGKSCFQFGAGTRTDRISFENCKFIMTNPNQVLFSTNSGVPMDLVIGSGCRANTLTPNTNINEIGGGVGRTLDFI